MESQGSFYKVLGVARTASDKDLRDAYKNAAMKAHPDKGGSHQEFSSLQKAYETLRDTDKRREYDRELQQKRQAKYFRRPPPMQPVKAPTSFVLQDGDQYIFETAPDRLRCKFRHGDIVSCAGSTGCFIGLGAFETLYWVKQGQTYASALFSLGMGDDLVKIVMRAAAHSAPQRKPSFTSPATATKVNTPSTPRRGSSAVDERVQRLRDEIIRDEKLRRADQRTLRMQCEERDRRNEVEILFREMLRDLKNQLVAGVRRLRLLHPRSDAEPSRAVNRVASRSPVRDYIRGKSPTVARYPTASARPQASPMRPPRAQTPVAPARKLSTGVTLAPRTPLRSVTPLSRARSGSAAAPVSAVNGKAAGGGVSSIRRGSYQIRSGNFVGESSTPSVATVSAIRRVTSVSPTRRPSAQVADPVPVIRFRRRED
jgi:curved DNA-binding protein CbpA